MRLVLLLSLALLSVGLQAEIVIENAKAYATAPGQANAAAFMTIKNTGEKAVTLSELHSDVAKKTEMHEQINKNGMMRMQQIKTFVVPAGGKQTLAHGGKHVMFIGLEKQLKPGDIINLQLCFGEPLCIKQAITVESLQATKHHHH